MPTETQIHTAFLFYNQCGLEISVYIAFFINTDIDILVFLETKNQPFHLRSLRNFLSCKEYHTIRVATLNMLFKLPVGNIYGMLGPNFSSLRRTLCKP